MIIYFLYNNFHSLLANYFLTHLTSTTLIIQLMFLQFDQLNLA
jgi:hypothetical protein